MRQTFTHEVFVYFDVVISGTFDRSRTAAEKDSSILEQFNSIKTGLQQIISDGGLDLPGMTINATSLRTAEYVMDCEYGTLPFYQTFTCRKYSL